jgi:CheY-like chemotaxis protein
MEALTSIRDAGQRAAELTAQLLAFGRKAIVDPKLLKLNQVIESSMRLLRRVLGETIRLHTDLAPNLAHVKIDPVQLEQILMNTLVNARDAMPQGGLLTIATANVIVPTDTAECRAGAYAQLTVSDTGEGMPKAVRLRIFEPFFTTKEMGKGTGLGLATVYGIVHQAGGSISVDSQLGVGTQIRVLLPAVKQVTTPPKPEVAASALHGTEPIVVVEDEPAVRRLICLVLRMHGYSVIEADGASTAHSVVECHRDPIHLLVTDVVMPDIGGRALADALRAVRPDLRVLYVSGYTDDAVVRYGVEVARDAFLQKPFTPQALAQKVRDVLDSAPLRVEPR